MRKNSSKKHGVNSLLNRSQSAMEYLMTYGWAILIIAIVLVALFSLGIFNSANFAQRAQPGSCDVLMNSAQTSLVGQCNGMLPEYVANFGGTGKISTALPTVQTVNTTMSAWFMPQTPYLGLEAIYYLGSAPPYPNSNGYGIVTSGANVGWCSTITHAYLVVLASSIGGYCFANSTFKMNAWNYVALVTTPDGSDRNFSLYLNGVHYLLTNNPIPKIPESNALIGYSIEGYPFSGKIANVQIYNASLSQSEIQALYQEGIGGAPINVNNLVGWWPLNGNANDYSGYGNDGTAANVTYTSAWTSSYSAP